jgi:hypothetical protein
MKANVVLKHRNHPRAVLRVEDDDYFVVTRDHYVDMDQSDDIQGGLALVDVKWLLNLTRETLVNIKVLGRYVTMQSAIQASTAVVSPRGC